jgi:Phenylacetic acid catabolic protein
VRAEQRRDPTDQRRYQGRVGKYFLGRRYAQWCSGAPTLESSVAAAAMAQDELGHARALPLLKMLAPKLGAELEPETRTDYHRMPFLDTDFDGWIDVVTANSLIDTARLAIFEALQISNCEPLGRRSCKVLKQESARMLLVTIPELPGRRYNVLGIVSVSQGRVSLDQALNLLGAEAGKIGGEAVIGIQIAIDSGSQTVVFHLVGTAITFA